ncbi:TRAP transporter fused permease subunit [Brevibacterium sp.]|uniref:TRAP transporter permease n=1 Tax=Brevibacterium sp. TaxID=1701 RepID=UPI0025B95243|nr:TRAP transporter fused permease subunit [Brevibacterium sp.]
METRLTPLWKAVVAVLTVTGVLLAMNQVFFWNPGGFTLLRSSYLYLVLACFLPICFLAFPLLKSVRNRPVPFYDVILALLAAGVCTYFGVNGETIVNQGWDYAAPQTAVLLSYLLWLLVLEALRRTAGLIVTLIALAFSLYPLAAGQMPLGFLRGISTDLSGAAQGHIMGADSVLGLPLQTAGTILIGFLLFGVALQHTGGATFFYDLAQALFGRYRGGSAKVSVFSSAFMGMMSGSAVSNVLTTGPMTIPAMKRAGFPGRYAAGIEATASTGGTITPPIMGSAAFIMVSFIGVPYSEIALAAAIPAILYFLGIFVQVDAYSAKSGLMGQRGPGPAAVGGILLRGWPYLAALIGLVALLVVQQRESQAPYWIVAFLLVVLVVRLTGEGKARQVPAALFDFLVSAGRTIAEIIGIIAGVGLIVGGLSMTGVSLSLARELVAAVGENLVLILLAGAVTCFILGMGMTVSAVYVFLAIVMAPALTQLGVNPIAAHLFVIYWATVSYITPPVGLAAFAAANIAKTPPMATAWTATRLGAVKYIVPFAFVFNPALLGQGAGTDIVLAVVFSAAGVFFLACAFEGWMTGVGRALTLPVRTAMAVLALGLFAPSLPVSSACLAGCAVLAVVTRFWNAGDQTVSAERERVRKERVEAADRGEEPAEV